MKKKRGLYKKQALTGHTFCIPLYIGAILFFIVPIIQSVIYSFSHVTPSIGTMTTEYISWDNFYYIFRVDLHFNNNLTASLMNMLYRVPFILVASLFLATIINQKFIGRTFVRAVFFLPVIVASGVVISLIQ
ncbi:MAG: sugar ABC transporter permease, partial [Clostridia bacterium]|nr:sugar ABC transporter permease [Clostridia bacterium]